MQKRHGPRHAVSSFTSSRHGARRPGNLAAGTGPGAFNRIGKDHRHNDGFFQLNSDVPSFFVSPRRQNSGPPLLLCGRSIR